MSIRARTLVILSVVLFFLVPVPPAFAALPSVNVPKDCTVTDTDSASHSYSGTYLGICALEAARAQGAIQAYTLQNFSFGLFLASMNGISPSDTEFWNIALNGTDASVGLSELVLAQGDTLTFQLKDFIENTDIGEPVAFIVSLQNSGESGGGGAGQIVVTFDVPAALAFLSEKQKEDGSFGESFITDWVAIALASMSGQNVDSSDAKTLVRTYLLTSAPTMTAVTDYERHAMALMALGIDPYIGTATDYITPIVESFDGIQIGHPSLVNDDVFALFPLPKAGYESDSDIISSTIAFILTKQGANGAWEESVDLTAAAIQALSPFSKVPGVANALVKAKGYLRETRALDGNWKNSFQMSWIVQALHASNESLSSWIGNGKSPMSALASTQEGDGGVESTTRTEQTRVWATAYAIPAALAKPWNDILQSFPKPVIIAASGTGGASTVAGAATSTATTTAVTSEPEENESETMSVIVETEMMTNPVQQQAVSAPPHSSIAGASTQAPAESIVKPAPLEQAQEALPETARQLAGAGTTNEVPLFFIMALILALAALLGAFGYPILSRLIRRLFR